MDLSLSKVCMSYWWPRVQSYLGKSLKIKLPETYLYYFSNKDITSIINGEEDYKDSNHIRDQIRHISSQLSKWRDLGDTKAFIRSGVTSLKHDWLRSCCLDLSEIGSDELLERICHLLYISNGFASPTDTIVLRRFINTEPLFKAFNQMPITTEVRCFVDQQKGFYHYQPYWQGFDGDKSIFITNQYEKPDIDNYLEVLENANKSKIKDQDIKELGLVAYGLSQYLGGNWSVDFLLDQKGDWYLIDIAPAGQSFKYTDFESNPANLSVNHHYTYNESLHKSKEDIRKAMINFKGIER